MAVLDTRVRVAGPGLLVAWALLVLAVFNTLTSAGAVSPPPALPDVLAVVEAVAGELGEQELRVLNAWRGEVLAAGDINGLQAQLESLRLSGVFDPLWSRNWDISLARFVLRMLMRPEPAKVLAEAATSRNAYETAMPQFESPGITPPLVLELFVDVDKRMSADTGVTLENFNDKVLSKFLVVVFSNNKYKPIYDAIEARLAGYGLSIWDLPQNTALLTQLPEYELIHLARQILLGNANLDTGPPTLSLVAGVVSLDRRSDRSGVAVGVLNTGIQALTDRKGFYLLPELPGGRLDVSFARPRFEAYGQLAEVPEGSKVFLGEVRLRLGDTNGDGLISLTDLKHLAVRYDYQGELLADLDMDGRVGLKDLVILATNLAR